MKVLIGRPVGGITLNGNEYVLDDNGNEMLFDGEEAAADFLKACGYTEKDMEEQGIVFEEVDV